jgi:hypothetical protein
VDLTRLRDVSFPEVGMLLPFIQQSLFGGYYPYECSILLLLVSRFKKRASACLVVSARLPIIPCYTCQHFLSRKGEGCLKLKSSL